jgi:hypothetical protein
MLLVAMQGGDSLSFQNESRAASGIFCYYVLDTSGGIKCSSAPTYVLESFLSRSGCCEEPTCADLDPKLRY